MAEIDYLQLHKDKIKELDELNKRRDDDNDLVTTYSYVLKDLNDKKINDVLSVTMNRLKIFKAYVEASLNKADEKIKVSTEDKNIDTSVIEDFIKSAYRSANEKLQRRGDFLIEPFIDQQSTMRGEAAMRILFQEMPAKEGREAFLDTDITNWDTRYITYERSEDAFAWTGYEIPMTKGVIDSQAWAVEIGYESDTKLAQVVELWTPEENIIYVADSVVFRQPNPYLKPPVVIQGVQIGSMLADPDSLKFRYESIFFLVRELINEYNLCLSILQTLNLKAIKVALQQPLKPNQEASDYNDVAAMGSVTPTVEGGGKIDLIPYGDTRNSMVHALTEINKALDDGTLSRITLGDLPGELSAVALIQIEQGQGQVFMPRLGNRGLLKEAGARMFIQQTIDLGMGSVEIGTLGHKKTFKVSDLEGEYAIDFVYANKSPETEFARVRMAKEFNDVLPELTILEDILKRDDPDGDFRKLNIQRAVQGSPTLQKYVRLLALREEEDLGSEDAAEMADLLELELNITIEQLQAGQLPGEEEVPSEEVMTRPRTPNEAAQDLMNSTGEPIGGLNG